MTIITEMRWKCDWETCGVLSPITPLEGAPMGWCVLNSGPRMVLPPELHHFCCPAHLDVWRAEQLEVKT